MPFVVAKDLILNSHSSPLTTRRWKRSKLYCVQSYIATTSNCLFISSTYYRSKLYCTIIHSYNDKFGLIHPHIIFLETLKFALCHSRDQKVEIFRAHPFQWPSKWIFQHQNHYVPRHINNGYIKKRLYLLNGSACDSI